MTGCGIGPGACVYTRATNDGYEYRCLNVGSAADCSDAHPSSGRFDPGVCCDSQTTRVDNPEACSG